MNERCCVPFLAWLVCLGLIAPVEAAPPWKKLLPFKKIDADPNKSYAVTESNGPWMILATVFHGENAERQAQQLAYELRKKYKLEAYTHVQVFDYTKYGRAWGVNADGTPSVKWQAHDDDVKQVAVLVGNFAGVDDQRATETLATIKKIEPEALRSEGAKSSQVFGDLRKFANARKQKGPMGSAFVATNPLLPPEYFNSAGLDKLVLEMNRDVPHSLLDCPGKYTVKVATFTGTAVIDQRRIHDVKHGKKMNYTLEEAAENAHTLTESLRRQGHEAYEFHDRQQSIVTVGSFDLLSVPGPNGQAMSNPQIEENLRTFGMQVGSAPGNPLMEVPAAEMARRQQLFPRHWKLLDMQPSVVEVPKKPLSAAYLR